MQRGGDARGAGQGGWQRRVLAWGALAVLATLAASAVLVLPATAEAQPGKRDKKATPAALLKQIEGLPPGPKRDEAVDALLDLGDAAWPEVQARLDALAALPGGEDTLVDLLLGFGTTSYDETLARTPKLSDGPALRVVRRVLRYPADERQLQLLESLLPRQDDEILRLVLPEVLNRNPPPALARLVQLVDDQRPNLRAFAIDTLVARKHDAALPVLVRRLGIEQIKPASDNLFVRLKLVHAIARLGADTDAPVAPLMEALGVPDQRDAVLDALQIVGMPAVKAAIFLLKTADRGRIETALQVISHLRLQAAPELLPLLAASDERTRELAVDMLAHVAVPQVRGEVVRMVREKRFVDFEKGLLLALTLYDATVRQLLLDLLADADDKVRLLAVRQLWRLADPETFVGLRASATRDVERTVRMTALQASVGVGDPKALEILRRMAEVQDQTERLAVIDTMGKVDDQAAVPVLARQLADPSDEVFRMALSALRRITYHTGPRREGEWTSWWQGEQGRSLESYEEIKPRVRTLVVDGRELALLEAGDADDPTIVVLSGPPFRDAAWHAPHVWRLAEDHHVVVLRRGVDAVTATSLTEEVLAQDLDKALGALRKGGVTLLADATAGHFAIAFAAAHPDDVARVVLYGGLWPTPAALERLPAEVGAAIPALWKDDVLWAVQRHALLVPALSQRAAFRGVLAALLGDVERGRRVAVPSLFDDGFTLPALDRLVAEARRFHPAKVTVPTLVLLGDKAPWAASAQQELAALPEATKRRVQLQLIPGAGGLPLVDAPEAAVKAIDAFVP